MSNSTPIFSQEDLQLLNSKKAFRYLLQNPVPDYVQVLERIRYEQEMLSLQAELIKMQAWVVRRKKRLVVVFEGRDFAGKGGAIRKFGEHLNPRNMRMVALPKPTVVQKRQWYFRRYIREFPNPGEIVFFDRSWYNRAIVEPVNGFCSKNQYKKFMSEVNQFEEIIMNDGIQLIKFYFSINKEEQGKRLDMVQKNPLKKWKLSKLDLNALSLWDEYSKYKDEMFKVTNRNNAPWVVIEANDSQKARVEAMKYVLKNVIYK